MTDLEKRLAEALRRVIPLLSRAHIGKYNVTCTRCIQESAADVYAPFGQVLRKRVFFPGQVLPN